MADLNEIGFEISDNEERANATILDGCPSPPPPFHHGRVEHASIVVEPPAKFTDLQSAVHQQTFVPFDNIFFHEAKTYLLQTTTVKTKAPRTAPNQSNSNLFSRFLAFARLSIFSNDNAEFDRQCDQLLNLAHHECLTSDRIHIRILYTIYRRLTSSTEVFYSTTGPHWEEIGFQNTNPETDFRSTGLFSVLCLHYFVDSMYLPLAKQIYQLSRQAPHDFPFCCVGINLANMIIKILRQSSRRINLRKAIEGKPSKYIPDSAATDLVGKTITALFLGFYLKWTEHGYTIVDTQKVFKELEETLTHRPKTLFEQFDDYFRHKENQKQDGTRSQIYQVTNGQDYRKQKEPQSPDGTHAKIYQVTNGDDNLI